MRKTITKGFLWLAVLVSGPLIGALLFDLVVLAGAWSADPPSSLAMMPYGAKWPVDTGMFFIPFSAALLVAAFGALIAGWRTPWHYRWLLCIPSLGVLALLVLTVTVFWPMNAALWRHAIHSPRDSITDVEAIAMARQWVQLDWVRFAGGAAIFIASVRALTLPWPDETAPKDPPLVTALVALAALGVAGFVIWFVSQI